MMDLFRKAWKTIGFTGLIALGLFGHLAYMNLRPADPILEGWQAYDPAIFERAMDRGEPMLVEIYASWCPTCKAQHEAFQTMVARGKAPAIRAIRVDYDRDGAFLKRFGVRGTGLLLLFRDGREIARKAGVTSPEKIAAFLGRHDIPLAGSANPGGPEATPRFAASR